MEMWKISQMVNRRPTVEVNVLSIKSIVASISLITCYSRYQHESRLAIGWEWRLLDHSQFPIEGYRVQRKPVTVPSDRGVDDHGRTLVGPHGADLLDEDPVTSAVVRLLKPDWSKATGFGDECD